MSSTGPFDVTVLVVNALYEFSYNGGGLSLRCKGDMHGVPPGGMTLSGSLVFSALPKNGESTAFGKGHLRTSGVGKITFDLEYGPTATLTVTSASPAPSNELVVSGTGFWKVEQS